jgi:hypothetical protein
MRMRMRVRVRLFRSEHSKGNGIALKEAGEWDSGIEEIMLAGCDVQLLKLTKVSF